MAIKEETKLLLRFRGGLQERMRRLQDEIGDLNKAIEAIDAIIVKSGFQQAASAGEAESKVDEDGASIKSKDGVVLGTVHVTDREIVFRPAEGLDFKVSTPPFQSFLVDRVLANMRTSDEARANRGEMPPEDALSYDVSTDGEILNGLVIRNFGGERRMREITSSLRWTLDKMHEKKGQ